MRQYDSHPDCRTISQRACLREPGEMARLANACRMTSARPPSSHLPGILTSSGARQGWGDNQHIHADRLRDSLIRMVMGSDGMFESDFPELRPG
jgi:hypothetical protein